jgi:DNA-binding PadR family transcriptional regulator
VGIQNKKANRSLLRRKTTPRSPIPLLKNLNAKRLNKKPKTTTRKRTRKVYTITEKGREYIETYRYCTKRTNTLGK